MPTLDLTFSNAKILSFFEGKSEVKPVGELIYAHTHPQLKNFMSELEVMVNITALHLQEHPEKSGVAHRLLGLAKRYAERISDVSEKTAPETLLILREIYSICSRFQMKEPDEI